MYRPTVAQQKQATGQVPLSPGEKGFVSGPKWEQTQWLKKSYTILCI